METYGNIWKHMETYGNAGMVGNLFLNVSHGFSPVVTNSVAQQLVLLLRGCEIVLGFFF